MRIAIVTGSRADWNGLGMVAKCLRADYGALIDVIAIGQHQGSSESLQTINGDGFAPRVFATNFNDDMAVGAGVACSTVGGVLGDARPDIALVCGDRFEIAGAALAASLRRIPIAHIGGGDITEGSIDNKLRYAITALADLHFVTNQDAMDRLTKMGYKSVYLLGNPALDRIEQWMKEKPNATPTKEDF